MGVSFQGSRRVFLKGTIKGSIGVLGSGGEDP